MKALKESSAWLRDPNVRAVWAILLVLVIPAAFTLYTVKVPMKRIDVGLNPTPLGYTVSLLIYLIPVLALHRWFARNCHEHGGIIHHAGRAVLRKPMPAAARALDFRRSAFRRTLVTLIPIGFLLDIVLGREFLTFDNAKATYFDGRFPAFDFTIAWFKPYIPVEEFVFYTLGFIAILLIYVWCDEYWLERYNVPDYTIPPGQHDRGLPAFIAQVMFLKPILIAVTLVALAWLYKKFGPHESRDGFPSYFTFLVVASLFPSILLFRATERFINWRALSFTVFWVALTSIIWEATLAAPYGWWGYNPWHMMGLFVGAWFGLPIEAVVLWLAVTFTTVMVYETYKILICIRRETGVSYKTAFFGDDFSEWINQELKPTGTGLDAKNTKGTLAKHAARIAGDRARAEQP